tara:strand:- start:1680 stop:2411 length:732 start_codon:yes stop_codon:yes gene_type:complete
MHRIYEIKLNTFKTLLLNKFENKFGIDKFENIHLLLNTNKLNKDEKKFYNIPIQLFGKTDRKSPFVKYFYKLFDTDYSILYEYLNFIKNHIKPLYPKEEYLVIQKTPNIRFHLPGYSNIGSRDTDKSKDIIGLHYDGEFGHPETEMNVILPITNMFDTNSIYYEKEPNSNLDYNKYNNLMLKENEFFMGYFNKCNHYNKINKTNITRVSIDFRIIPYSKYKDNNETSATSKTKFEIGKYYMII